MPVRIEIGLSNNLSNSLSNRRDASRASRSTRGNQRMKSKFSLWSLAPLKAPASHTSLYVLCVPKTCSDHQLMPVLGYYQFFSPERVVSTTKQGVFLWVLWILDTVSSYSNDLNLGCILSVWAQLLWYTMWHTADYCFLYDFRYLQQILGVWGFDLA